ncbi:MAG TPA: LysR family transcriptional regulator [Acetobacteraceae bacterium]|nr:LysR family transcriptional regulator [Acetobacteraceae bacterium]
MELHEIRYFLMLCRTLNFTRAAEQCHVSQPALTRAIQKLEDEFGGLLFCRERNNTHLTELGRMIEPHLMETMARADAAKQVATQFQRLDRASLRLGVTSTVGPARFVGLLTRFRAAHPGVHITMAETGPLRLRCLLETGAIDVALLDCLPGPQEAFQVQRLYRERFVVACAAGHPFARRESVSMAELDGQFYLSRIADDDRDMIAEACAAAGVRLVRAFRGEREDWIMAMVAAGIGICFLPEHSTAVPGVASRPVLDLPIESDVFLLSVAGRRWSRPLAAFVQAARQYCWPEPVSYAA